MSTQFSVARPAVFSAQWDAKAETPLRAVVVGGSGQIGGWLFRYLAERGHQAVGTYSSQAFSDLIALDAADLDAVTALLRAERPDVVFYPAGFTWVDGCERDKARAYAANLEQPLHVARTAADLGARFVYFSTDYVFDGVKGRYSEDAPTNPLSVYGQAKYDAEVALAEALGDRLLTVRTCWVYGPERQGKNFSYQLIRALEQGKPMTCPSDQISSPSYGPDVARAVLLLVEAGASGLIHVVGPEIMDRVRFARAIARAFDLDESLITATPTAELGQGAPRPLNAGLLIDRLESCKPGLMRSLDAALEDFRAKLGAPELRSWLAPALTTRS
ncbi:MAG: SDR family oxidoreductase [Paludisphaera borealis]|uniref:SDR family oxidoreductase n=1 Tax=Paludisphaera borealis TaxID=1387353 RepID=UPI00283EF87F|nr:SDR family oxidoreductase [Paludisphaera borealis]MDR3622143.1 SDR family oxidoreductase [Paludisphaera borealis]